MSDVCLVHLVWKPLGPDALAAFLQAYRRIPPGMSHRLVVLLNGFAPDDDREPYRRLLAGIAHDEIDLPAPVQDIAAYTLAARQLRCTFICFLNSYSEPLVADWLLMLHSHLRAPGVGVVGATGSWESHLTNVRRLLAPRGVFQSCVGTLIGGPKFSRRIHRARRSLAARLAPHFDPFPLPHLRTNGFMVRRELLLALDTDPIHDKLDALKFESGREGLMRRIESLGLRALVVTRDGEAHPPSAWWCCGGYRSGEQQNLLIADNRTRQFSTLDRWWRRRVLLNTWGRDPEATSRALAAVERARLGAR